MFLPIVHKFLMLCYNFGMERKNKLRKQKLKSYTKQLNSNNFDVDNELEIEENSCLIECNVGKPENIFSVFDTAKNRSISTDFNNYLMEQAEIIPMEYDITLKMHVQKDFNEAQESQVKTAIRNHFSFQITKDRLTYNKNKFHASLLYLLGFILLLCIPFINMIETTFPLTECFLIIIWFCVWEATDMTVLNNGQLKKNQINKLRLYNAKIVFERDFENK